MKFVAILLFFLSYTLPSFSQTMANLTFRDYPVLQDLDSLERAVELQKNNPDKYLFGLVTLERSRGQLSSDKFGQYLPLIDSISRNRNLPNIQAAYLILEADHINYDGYERVKTLEYSNKALDLFTQQKDTTGMIRCYSKLRYLNVSATQGIEGSAEMAGIYFQNLANLANHSSWPGDKLISFFNRRSQYASYYKQHPDSLIHLVMQALNIIKANPEFKYFTPAMLNNLAGAYEYKGDYQQSLRVQLECLRLTPDQWYTSKILYNYNVGSAYYRSDNFAKAEYYLREAIRLGELHKTSAGSQASAVFTEALVQYNQNRYEESIVNFIKADSLKNVSQNELRTKDFLELQTKYETDKKEIANQVLTKEKQSYEAGIIAAAILVGIISILLFYLFQKNKQLDEYAHFRDQIFTIISHDLRSPVMALEGLSKQASFLIKRGETNTLELVGQRLDSSVLQLNGLLNNLLAWAISQNTKMDTRMEALPLLPLVNEIVQLYTEIANAKGIAISINIPDDLVVKANKNGLSVIIRNLVDNAVKNTSSKKVSIEAKKVKDKAIIKVCNNDVIMSPELILKIQNQLKGIKASYLQTASGFGLQLIAHFIRLHKGSVVMKSDAEEGTVFTVMLPA